jgi:hypothetical protein
MIAAGGIIAFLIIVIIIIGIIGLAPFAVKRLSAKLNFRIIGGYLAVLIVLSLVCLLLPGGVLVKGADTSQEAGNPDANAYQRITAGDFDAPDGFTKTEKDFDPLGGSVRVTCGENLEGMVFVGTKGVDVPDNGDGKIDVYSYSSATVNFGNMYFVPEIGAPDLAYSGGNLTVSAASQKEKDFYQFDDGYALGQFFSGQRSLNSGSIVIKEIFVLLPRGMTASGTGFVTVASLKTSAG